MSQSASPEERAIGAWVDPGHLLHLRHLVAHWPEIALATTGRPGGFTSKRRGSGLEILELRPFVEGDDIRHLDALATARTGKRHVRVYHDERERAAMLIADFRPSMFWGTRRRLKSVAAAEVLALNGWRTVVAGGKVGLMTLAADGTSGLPLKDRDRAMVRVVGGLAGAHATALEQARVTRKGPGETEDDPPLDALLARAGKRLPSGASLILATALDHPGPNFAEVLGTLSRRFRVTVNLIRDAFEIAPPSGLYPHGDRNGLTGRAWVGPRAKGVKVDTAPDWLRDLGANVTVIDSSAEDKALLGTLETAAWEGAHGHRP
ncbi:DUF58 domain-containing protein [Rhodospirillum sp. A1_3_36]|uniref:DUF58 domain-containing protein n=1 Tax=Rhodospirillum sp. A1_3_36 TaxID=3391666 RepID=UPI0039A4F311